MPNKANLGQSQIFVTPVSTMTYNEKLKLDTWSKRTQTKPILKGGLTDFVFVEVVGEVKAVVFDIGEQPVGGKFEQFFQFDLFVEEQFFEFIFCGLEAGLTLLGSIIAVDFYGAAGLVIPVPIGRDLESVAGNHSYYRKIHNNIPFPSSARPRLWGGPAEDGFPLCYIRNEQTIRPDIFGGL